MRVFSFRNLAQFIPIGFYFLGSLSAQAECPFLGAAIQRKIVEYQEYRERNDLTLKSLLETKKTCETKGAALSSTIASKADALSCQAELDASKMDLELRNLGEKCEGTFRKIHNLQLEMKSQFELVQGDIEEGFAFMKSDEMLLKYCMPEIQVAKKTVEAFVLLETQIVQVEIKSLDGQDNYGKFTKMAQQLHRETATRGGNCGELVVSVGAIAKAAQGESGRANSNLSPRGQFPNPASDITGTDRSKLVSKASEAKIERPKMPDMETAKNFSGSRNGQSVQAPKSKQSMQIAKSLEVSLEARNFGLPGRHGQAARAIASIAELEPKAGKGLPPARSVSIAQASVGEVLWKAAGPVNDAKLELESLVFRSPDQEQNSEPEHEVRSSSQATKVVALGELSHEQVNAIAVEANGGGQQQDLFERVSAYYRHSNLFETTSAQHAQPQILVQTASNDQ